MKVEIYDGTSAFGEVTKQATQVKDGTIDIALGLRGAEGDRFPRSSIIELPFVVQQRAEWFAGAVEALQGRRAGRRVPRLQGARTVRAQSRA